MTTILTQKVRHPSQENTWIPIFKINEENNAQTVLTYGKLADSDAVNTSNISDDAIWTNKIKNRAVTTDKINDEAVTAAKINYTLNPIEQDSNIYYLQIND